MGQPTELAQYPALNKIGARRRTRRTETSKYPEEEKTKVITLVAASERVLAQTISFTDGMGL